ncbi:ABC transporter ATP-binding protein [Brochothrix thermosphacta]|uniref:ABC transporter ATP-binding protein n=1 Tax=Brochothrix thermosphacta TaxID=2756 RepID=UPI0003E851F1|nr:ABC transporter ATP-binding protein [Brochothrix thermosphacta]SLM97589.1 ABC transporter, ATP-binding protein [Brachybacterium faecium]ANZ97564.1 antibiotic ABC transporter ATP-binding protein [Brochothrix thermosphacta]EUJ33986.1 antibiotic ABC transporter ATP-binding protein [Brochothrix thermosphacta DSM 20171 = FSL F6-1036]ODJ50556.1 antibiotic ABC transporter ATP-binding protein [Brochothrix thermosphacta DSM 20171 = FSL F6-1036]ODJ60241.1 antibiotic ABC transporter ATP-binding protei
MSLLELKNVIKTFKRKRILHGVSLEADKGMIIGISGANGSGKTTILRLLAGLVYPDSGKVFVGNQQLQVGDIPQSVGVLLETPVFINNRTAIDNLMLLANIRGAIKQSDIEKWLLRFGLEEDKNLKVKTYSLGMNQRLGLIQAMMEKPEVLLLDEPTNALDDYYKTIFYDTLLEAKANGTTAVIVSHDQIELAKLCDRVYRIEEGRLSTKTAALESAGK